jgi:hypothetical protein
MEGLAVFEKAWYTFTVGALFAPQPAYGQRIAAQAAIGKATRQSAVAMRQ